MYAGGNLYAPNDNNIANNFVSLPDQYANFRLSGTVVSAVVPEPGTYALLCGLVVPGVMLMRRRRA